MTPTIRNWRGTIFRFPAPYQEIAEIAESAGTISLDVQREFLEGTVTVTYAIVDVTTTRGDDYNAAATGSVYAEGETLQTIQIPIVEDTISEGARVTSGTLTFADGETSKKITVPIVDDRYIEYRETFKVELSYPSFDASLGSLAEATVVIYDKDHL